MTNQAQLFIGKRVHSYAEARSILDQVGAQVPARIQERDHKASEDDVYEARAPITLTYKGKAYETAIRFHHCDPDYRLPIPDIPSTGALVGVDLTGRYYPSIIDQDSGHMDPDNKRAGRPEPFVIDLAVIQNLLEQVWKIWDGAEFLICDVHY